MSRQYVFNTPVKLWHRIDGWRTFDEGSTDPGGAWYEEENGDIQPKGAHPDVTRALDGALAEAEALTRRLASAEASLAEAAGRAQAATDRAVAAEALHAELQRAIKAAEDLAVELTAERDRARAQLAKFDRDGDGSPGGSGSSAEKDEMIAQLETLGLKPDKRKSPATLRAELDAATAPAAA